MAILLGWCDGGLGRPSPARTASAKPSGAPAPGASWSFTVSAKNSRRAASRMP
ncbi:hypothetical protein [Inquilinus limosus]|uniref:hypothetical protein n=1 Tax=Inquilinus limosus TaxID=171674 RepID=UPI0015C65E77|nr:hypothetical protein [Inquilinus limosus]